MNITTNHGLTAILTYSIDSGGGTKIITSIVQKKNYIIDANKNLVLNYVDENTVIIDNYFSRNILGYKTINRQHHIDSTLQYLLNKHLIK